MQNLSANFIMIDFLILSKRFVFISFWEQTFSLTELMSCFTEDTFRALQSIVGQSRAGTKYSRMDQVKFEEKSLWKILFGPYLNTLFHLSGGTQKLLDGTITFFLKCATSNSRNVICDRITDLIGLQTSLGWKFCPTQNFEILNFFSMFNFTAL